jgi:HK97 family phage prohead protease
MNPGQMTGPDRKRMLAQMTRDTWTTAYVNDLPDSAFLLIGPGGHKDADGKTLPRSLRYFPVRNAAGDVDEPHVANALARIPQASTLSASQRENAMAKAKALAKGTNVSGAKGEYAGSAGSGRSRGQREILTRSFSVDLEIREAGDGRTLHGRAVPYGETINLRDGTREAFAYGAFADQIASGQVGQVKLYASHQDRTGGQQPIGKTATLSETQGGLVGTWPLYNTTKANDSLELVRTGEVTGLSIGFSVGRGGTQDGPNGLALRTAAHLDHVVLTHEPAYQTARVMAIRDAGQNLPAWRREAARHHAVLDRLRVPR